MRHLILMVSLATLMLVSSAIAHGPPPAPPFPHTTWIGTPGSSGPQIDRQIYWPAASFSVDGVLCTAPAEATLAAGGPIQYTVLCADDDAAAMYGSITLGDGWDAGTLLAEVDIMQTAASAADTYRMDISCECRSDGVAVDNSWGTEVVMSDTVSGDSKVDHIDGAGALTCNGTCAAGDTLFWRVLVDQTNTDTAVGTAHILGLKLEIGTSVSD